MLRVGTFLCSVAVALSGCARNIDGAKRPVDFQTSARPDCPTADVAAAANDDEDAHLKRWIDTATCFARSAQHPLHRLHLESIARILTEMYIPCVGDTFPDQLQTPAEFKTGTVKNLRESFSGFVESGWRFQDYVDRKRPLIFAIDGRGRQHMQMYLPKQWDPARSYPMHVYIHGHEPHQNIGRFWARDTKGPAVVVEQQQRSVGGSFPLVAAVHGDGFSVRGYYYDQCQVQEFGLDLSQSIVKFMFEHFGVDRDRVFLEGGSMGSQGSWNASSRMPGVFAAVVLEWTRVFEGARPTDAVVGNLAQMPFRILGGERDQMERYMLPYRAALREIGNEPDWFVEPGAGHGAATPARGLELSQQNYDWLVLHVRKRPDRFTFTTDRMNFRGAWGIIMEFKSLDPAPGFDLAIDGSTISITARNTHRLTVDLGPAGLNVRGNVTVLANGKQVYSGGPALLNVGI